MLDYNRAPTCPGVYIMKDKAGKVIYVGKAKSLKNRIRSYLTEGSHPKTRAMLSNVETIDYIVTNSEKEALLLEANLIKLHLPGYNIRLKDDKKYPYIKITIKEDFPTMIPTREINDKTAIYFGPYTGAKNMRGVLKSVTEIFPVRVCKRMPKRVCASYYIRTCPGPCEGKIEKEEYRKIIQEIIDFLSGRSNRVEKRLKKELQEYKSTMEFEKAIVIRDRLKALSDMIREQRVVLKNPENLDLFGLAKGRTSAVVAVMKVRDGRMIGLEHYRLNIPSKSLNEEIIETFFVQYYKDTYYIPDRVLLPALKEIALLESWIKDRKPATRLIVPKMGEKLSLIKLATENAMFRLYEKGARPDTALLDLKTYLHLKYLPRLIEGYDISNISGEYAVGSKVLFRDGKRDTSLYRRYRVREVGIDDPKMMREIIERRLREKGELPSLIIVDGGITQVRSAQMAIDTLPCNEIAVFGLAKRQDQLYTRDGKVISIPKTSPALRLLQRLRDEAHRFALDYHRRLRDRPCSILDEIDGIGRKRRDILLKHFGSLKELKKVGVKDIESVPGMGRIYAERIDRFLKQL